MSALTITTAPYLDRDGRWTVVARRGAMVFHVALRSKGDWLREVPVEELARALAQDVGITTEQALQEIREISRPD